MMFRKFLAGAVVSSCCLVPLVAPVVSANETATPSSSVDPKILGIAGGSIAGLVALPFIVMRLAMEWERYQWEILGNKPKFD